MALQSKELYVHAKYHGSQSIISNPAQQHMQPTHRWHQHDHDYVHDCFTQKTPYKELIVTCATPVSPSKKL